MTLRSFLWSTTFAAATATATVAGLAQQDRPATPPPDAPTANTSDPRVGLKPGATDAGVAAWNLELVASMPKPPGFDDPAGTGGLNFANSDLAFQRTHVFQGNFNGFNFYNVEDPRKPQLLTSVPCPGGQGDLSVYGHLLFMSVEQTRGRIDCGTQGVADPVSADRFRGVRIFDISDPRKPRQIAAVQTCRGSHTHSLVTSASDPGNVYVYVSGTSSVRPGEELAGCSGGDPKEDPDTALYRIDIIQVPLAHPETAHIVNNPRIFSDPLTGDIAGLWAGGTHGDNTQRTSVTNQCHDITAYPALGLAAGACSGNGILLDISDPVHPVRLDAVVNPNFAYWHSASFNNDGTKVIFTDEWGGGTQPRCRATDPLTWGADAIFTVVDRKLKFASYYKMPAAQTDQENCVAHNGSLVPVPGRDIKTQAWYQGGVSVFDFTDAAHPVEIAYFDRGPYDANKIVVGGFWSTYWYNGYIYGSEIARGLDVFRLTPSKVLTQNEIDAANLVRFDELNVQDQPHLVWPAAPVVARAYLDQLERTNGFSAGRIEMLRQMLDTLDRSTGKARDAVLKTLADAALDVQRASTSTAADDQDSKRLRGLAETLRGMK